MNMKYEIGDRVKILKRVGYFNNDDYAYITIVDKEDKIRPYKVGEEKGNSVSKCLWLRDCDIEPAPEERKFKIGEEVFHKDTLLKGVVTGHCLTIDLYVVRYVDGGHVTVNEDKLGGMTRVPNANGRVYAHTLAEEAERNVVGLQTEWAEQHDAYRRVNIEDLKGNYAFQWLTDGEGKMDLKNFNKENLAVAKKDAEENKRREEVALATEEYERIINGIDRQEREIKRLKSDCKDAVMKRKETIAEYREELSVFE